jgi:hypothetical protein
MTLTNKKPWNKRFWGKKFWFEIGFFNMSDFRLFDFCLFEKDDYTWIFFEFRIHNFIITFGKKV